MQHVITVIRPAGARMNDDASYSYGAGVPRELKSQLENYWTEKDRAIGKAQELAGKYPNMQFAVMSITEIFEGLPKIVAKKLNDNGEIVNV